MPGLKIVGAFKVTGDVKIRPADLYVSAGHRQAGVVLVGDAFGTSCPVTGTGAGKVFNDVQRLCNVHVPRWLASPGMGEEKIVAFYDDPVKCAYDAFPGTRPIICAPIRPTTAAWRARRWARFL